MTPDTFSYNLNWRWSILMLA